MAAVTAKAFVVGTGDENDEDEDGVSVEAGSGCSGATVLGSGEFCATVCGSDLD